MQADTSIISRVAQGASMWLAAMLLFATALPDGALAAQHGKSGSASAAGEETVTSPKIHEFITLLADPSIQKWLKEEDEKKSAAETSNDAADQSISHYFASRLSVIREHIVVLAGTLPDLPKQFGCGFGLL